MATTKRSNPSRHLVEKQRKEREREKIYLNYSRKFDRSSKAFTIPPFESKLNWSINSPNRSCWENTRGPSLELARAFLFHAKRTMPCNAYAISHCPTLIRSLLPPPPSFPFSSIITRATKFFLSLSYLSLDCWSLYQGVHKRPSPIPFRTSTRVLRRIYDRKYTR